MARHRARFVRAMTPAPWFGNRFQQDIEPAGRYMIHNPDPGEVPTGWESGTVRFRSPLVIAWNAVPGAVEYDTSSWKAALSSFFLEDGKGLTGERLSRTVIRYGYDGIVTAMLDVSGKAVGTREIVDLTPLQRTVGA